jgi:RNA polymerase sigma-70 factor (ECF subfamily)
MSDPATAGPVVDHLPASLAPGLELIARRALSDPDDARDAVQETLARAFAAVRDERVPPDVPLAAFVHGIAKHVIADVLRRRARDGAADPAVERLAAPSPSPLEALIDREERERVRRALGRLPRSDRDLLHRCFVAGERVVDIAARTGEPAERVRKRKSRALERLRDLLAEPGAARHGSSPGPTLVT